MKKLIELSDTYYIIVDDSEIKEGDWVYKIQHSHTPLFYVNCAGLADDFNRNKDNYKKITHSTKPLEHIKIDTMYEGEGWSKIKQLSLSEVEELINGYNVEKMADNVINQEGSIYKEAIIGKSKWIEGFKAHQELVKDKLFTIEDMRKVYTAGWMNKLNNEEIYIDGFNKFIQSLLPKTQWKVKFNEQGKLELV